MAILERGITVESADDLGLALGTSAGGRIQILNGLSPAQTLVVLAHEFAHELLHRADDRPASRDTRELEAEACNASAHQIRETALWLIAACFAIDRVLQWVASRGVVSADTSSATMFDQRDSQNG